MLRNLWLDHISTIPRRWSNQELARFSDKFTGNIINVSAWHDSDKEGKNYRDYFTHASSYTTTNFKQNMRGYQGLPHEIFLDLEQPLSPDLHQKYDVVFNHTTLEHVYNFQLAFHNLCQLSRDIVIVVVPFMQKMHGDYGDYWRFSPQAIEKLFHQEGLSVLYLSFNNDRRTSVYIFALASKNPTHWSHLKKPITYSDKKFIVGPTQDKIGSRAIQNNLFIEIVAYVKSLFHRPG